METSLFQIEYLHAIVVFTLPMRNGNYCPLSFLSCFGIVFTLPMRNGNSCISLQSKCCGRVFTLPMRNGNIVGYQGVWGNLLFLPYLWGMETWYNPHLLSLHNCFYLTYEEWKLFKIIIRIIINKHVFTLPMRNGNVYPSLSLRLAIVRFYLTYEEWKLS